MPNEEEEQPRQSGSADAEGELSATRDDSEVVENDVSAEAAEVRGALAPRQPSAADREAHNRCH